MHTASSANRTWRELRSASEYTATVGIPSSLQAQMTRNAISPRLAIRILRNIADDVVDLVGKVFGGASRCELLSSNNEWRGAIQAAAPNFFTFFYPDESRTGAARTQPAGRFPPAPA